MNYKLVDSNIDRIECQVNGDEYDGLSFEFLYYNQDDEFSFKEQYNEDNVVNVEKTLGIKLYRSIESRLGTKKCLFFIDTKTNGADFTIKNVIEERA